MNKLSLQGIILVANEAKRFANHCAYQGLSCVALNEAVEIVETVSRITGWEKSETIKELFNQAELEQMDDSKSHQ